MAITRMLNAMRRDRRSRRGTYLRTAEASPLHKLGLNKVFGSLESLKVGIKLLEVAAEHLCLILMLRALFL